MINDRLRPLLAVTTTAGCVSWSGPESAKCHERVGVDILGPMGALAGHGQQWMQIQRITADQRPGKSPEVS